MDLERISNALLKWVMLNINSTTSNNDKPSVSYIINKIVNFNTARDIMSNNNMSGMEILKLSYLIYFISEGDDFKTALNKSNKLYFFNFINVEDIVDVYEECDECYGNGEVDCSWCDGEGVLDCDDCEGTGTTTSDADGEEEEKDCSSCDGLGNPNCENCGGDRTLECSNCDGDGRIETNKEEVNIENNKWVFHSPILAGQLKKEIENNYKTDNSIYDILDGFKKQVNFLGHTSDTVEKDELETNLNVEDISIGDVFLMGIREMRSEDYIDLGEFNGSYNLRMY
tara:strand:+ start:3644 stop:4495 length:852 start_codon:yes stop_codon:yes gene_type:complete